MSILQENLRAIVFYDSSRHQSDGSRTKHQQCSGREHHLHQHYPSVDSLAQEENTRTSKTGLGQNPPPPPTTVKDSAILYTVRDDSRPLAVVLRQGSGVLIRQSSAASWPSTRKKWSMDSPCLDRYQVIYPGIHLSCSPSPPVPKEASGRHDW